MHCHLSTQTLNPTASILEALPESMNVVGASFPLLAIFLFSLLGSSHCMAMCGPQLNTVMVGSGGKSKLRLIKYNFYRLISYLLVAVIAYFFKTQIQNYFELPHYSLLILFGSVSLVLLIGVRLKRQKGCGRKCGSCTSKSRSKSPLLGLISGVLPCVTLTPVLLYAATLDSISSVLATIGVFWLGTLPVMFFAAGALALIVKKIPKPITLNAHFALSGLMLCLGIYLKFVEVFS